MVIGIDPLLDPEFEAHVAVLDLLPDLDLSPVIVDPLLDPDIYPGIIVVMPVTTCLRAASNTGGQRQSHNCCDPKGTR